MSSLWVAGPSKGVFAVGQADICRLSSRKQTAQASRKHSLHPGGAVTLLSLLFVVMPRRLKASTRYSQLTVLLYLIAYLLMFGAAIHLRYTMKDDTAAFPRRRRGNWLMWLIGGVGFLGSMLASFSASSRPTRFRWVRTACGTGVLFGGVALFVILPFVILHFRNRHGSIPKAFRSLPLAERPRITGPPRTGAEKFEEKRRINSPLTYTPCFAR